MITTIKVNGWLVFLRVDETSPSRIKPSVIIQKTMLPTVKLVRKPTSQPYSGLNTAVVKPRAKPKKTHAPLRDIQTNIAKSPASHIERLKGVAVMFYRWLTRLPVWPDRILLTASFNTFRKGRVELWSYNNRSITPLQIGAVGDGVLWSVIEGRHPQTKKPSFMIVPNESPSEETKQWRM